ncbi:Copper chaperone [Microbacterium esteraromaticum]|uniref:Copper chaperone n=1 Tax=Microbacterium esteraromaticum TaxID=57043 RepID=A0A1R4IM44_9MICO|nr:heavy metal-associated domain-containing protein [Microbacterium esteraromaticum]SJN20664.1 Copper chaperone [Microbacterium esteraromaticum]
MTTTEFTVTGMTCAHCEKSVREEVEKIAGIEGIDVSAQTGRLLITSDAEADATAVIAAVDEAGYQAASV